MNTYKIKSGMLRAGSLLVLAVLALGLMAFAPAVPPVQTPGGDQVVLGDNYTLQAGETLAGSLIVMGGNANLEEGSTVEGDIVIMGGNLQAAGRIQGDVTVIGGLVTLNASAVVEGDVNTLSSNLVQDEGAQIEGDINRDLRFPFFFNAPGAIPIPEIGELPVPPVAPTPSAVDMGLKFIGGVFWWLGRSFLWALAALGVMLFMPRHTARVAEAAMVAPAASGLMGLLTVLVAPLVLGLLVLTICGIPIALVGMLVLALAWALGIIALGLETGRRLIHLLQQDWAPTVQAAAGTFVLTLLINGISAVVICVGWLVPFVVGLIGLGAVLLTRAGGQDYPTQAAAVASPPAAPAVIEGEFIQPGGDDLPPAS